MDTGSPCPQAPAGLLLLTGGQGARLGGPKHLQPHPLGGTWGERLVEVFREVFPGAPVLLLGHPLPERPDLPVRPDAGQGPAAALLAWAREEVPGPGPSRWWLCACDHPAWTPRRLRAWHGRVQAADPGGGHWVLGQKDDYIQYLGGWFPHSLKARLAGLEAASMGGLAQGLPVRLLEVQGAEWEDVDTPEDLRAWRDRSAPG